MPEIITIEDAAQLKRLQERSLIDIWRETPEATKYQAMKNLGLAGVDFVADMIPVVSDIKAAQEFATGKRELLKDVPGAESQVDVSRLESLINLIPAIPSVGLMTKALHGAAPGRELFANFDKKFIGTGEGGKARGWGFYFTDVRDIAADVYAKHGLEYTNYYTYKGKEYTNLQELTSDKHTQRLIAESIFKGRQIDPTNPKAGALKHLEGISGVSDTKEAREILQNISSIEKGKPGYVYNVTLHPHKEQENWLEWDSIIPQEQINRIFNQAEREKFLPRGGVGKINEKGQLEVKGGDLYHNLSNTFGSDKKASEFLDRAGIDGIRFEAGSIMGIKPKVMRKEVNNLSDDELLKIIKDDPFIKPETYGRNINEMKQSILKSESSINVIYNSAKQKGFIPEHYNYVIFNPEHIQINQIEDVAGKVVKKFTP